MKKINEEDLEMLLNYEKEEERKRIEKIEENVQKLIKESEKAKEESETLEYYINDIEEAIEENKPIWHNHLNTEMSYIQSIEGEGYISYEFSIYYEEKRAILKIKLINAGREDELWMIDETSREDELRMIDEL